MEDTKKEKDVLLYICMLAGEGVVENWIVHHADFWGGRLPVVRMKMSMPSYTAQPMAELRTLRERRNTAPSKNPGRPRCCNLSVCGHVGQIVVLTFHTVETVCNSP